jgi:catechol 2,3-dioxygenase-like lactoylglutathione lyase family enzyme
VANFDLHHIHHKAADIEKAARFYTDCLGAKETGRKEEEGRGLWMIDVDLCGVRIRITTFHAASPTEQSPGLEHLSLDTDDLPGVIEQLKALGAPFTEERGEDGKMSCYATGPDGTQIYILQGHAGHKY